MGRKGGIIQLNYNFVRSRLQEGGRGGEGRGGGREEEIWRCCEEEWEGTGGQRSCKWRVSGRRGKSGLGEVGSERGRERVGEEGYMN